MADGRPRPDADRAGASTGWRRELRDVIVVAVVVVGAVLTLAAIATFVPPIALLFDRLPIAIIVLIAGTVWVLWRISRRSGAG